MDKMRLLTTLLVVVTISGLVGCGRKVAPSSVSGKLTIDGAPLANGLVQLFETRGGLLYDTGMKTRTDSQGNYRFDRLTPGAYRLQLYKMGEEEIPLTGYDASRGAVQFTVPKESAGQALTQNFTLGIKPGVAAPGTAGISQVTCSVNPTPSPTLKAVEVHQALSAVPGVDAGSIHVDRTQIRFRIKSGMSVKPAEDALKKLGVVVTFTMVGPVTGVP